MLPDKSYNPIIFTHLKDNEEWKDQLTLGRMMIPQRGADDVTIKMAGLPWFKNTNRISCSPIGTYKIVKKRTGRIFAALAMRHRHTCVFETLFPYRSAMLTHPAGFPSIELMGCTAPYVEITKMAVVHLPPHKKKLFDKRVRDVGARWGKEPKFVPVLSGSRTEYIRYYTAMQRYFAENKRHYVTIF